MSSIFPLLIEDGNLSRAWARIFLHIIDNPGKEISPLLVSLTGFTDGIPNEDETLRSILDACFTANGKQEVNTVANTIFPASVWRLAKYNRQDFYGIYMTHLPRYIALKKNKNHRGLYFARLIAFDKDHKTGKQLKHIPVGSVPENGNQLEHIIKQYLSRPGVRRSMFQASVFDPARDHVLSAQLPFPCLQHISFVPEGNGLILNAFYATQQLFDKAYGNYLGLCRLGHFMAHEMHLTLKQVNCYAGIEKMDTIGKTHRSLIPLIEIARVVVA